MTAAGFSFVVINDLHYTDEADRPWLLHLMRQINQTPGVELCLVLGDLGELGTEQELAAAKEILETLQNPWYTVPGNHDGPPNRAAGRSPEETTAGLATYNHLFPNRRNYVFNHRDWQFIALDTTDGSEYQNIRLRSEAIEFLQKTVPTLDRQKPTIVFTHLPVAPGVPYGLANGLDLLELLRPLNVRTIFSGHYHGMSHALIQNVQLVTNRCISMRREIHDGGTTRGYLLCKATPAGNLHHDYIEYHGPPK